VTRRLAILAVCLAALALMLPTGSAGASQLAFPGVDCKESPTPDMPGQGLAGFFEKTPQPVPDQGDPFAEGARTTMYEQYGYSGLRWHTYDLGCGPDAARNPDAMLGQRLGEADGEGRRRVDPRDPRVVDLPALALGARLRQGATVAGETGEGDEDDDEERGMRYALGRPDALLQPPVLVELEPVLADLGWGLGHGASALRPPCGAEDTSLRQPAQRPRIAFTYCWVSA